MLPTLGDVTDFIAAIKYNIGLSKQKPHFPRFNFMEKIEYWAVVWGTVLMTITGYVLWNPVLITQYLPGRGGACGQDRPRHGGGAGGVVDRHLARLLRACQGLQQEHVHRPSHAKRRWKRNIRWSWSGFARAGSGGRRRPELRYSRLKLYAPLATLFVLVSVLGTWRWLTAEATAITTVPRAAVEERVYQPVGLAPRTVNLAATPLPTPLSVLSVAGRRDRKRASSSDACLHQPACRRRFPTRSRAGKPSVC